jgi:sugar-specific transcriptional regulator TrmB
MDLTLLGLNHKESQFYNHLLQRGPMAVKELESLTGEQRTNCYVILKALEDQNLVVRDDLHAVLRFCANDPQIIRKILLEKQADIQNVNKYLTKSLPKLSSLYRLTTEQQGVAYFNDIDGLRVVHEDMLAAGGPVRSFISETIAQDQPALYESLVKQSVAKRSRLGITSQFIACKATEPYLSKVHFKQPGIEVRVLDAALFDGEVTIYGHKVALTSYKAGALQTIVMNDKALARTFRSIFEACWNSAAHTTTV